MARVPHLSYASVCDRGARNWDEPAFMLRSYLYQFIRITL
jgi:hypothetical protein